ncbi:MAG: hypothetical protein L0241_00700 [Planctomycetia bacterium]|nr:hypothetical protein [Planctomycetia bacterium]
MTLRRLSVALVVVSGLFLLGLTRIGAQAESQPADPVYSADQVETSSGSAHDAAIHRFRGNHSRHWRQIMVTSQ